MWLRKLKLSSHDTYIFIISADGITYSFGTFLVELMNVFGEGRGSASLIPSILVGVTLGVGPIASSMVNRYGCRAVTIAGMDSIYSWYICTFIHIFFVGEREGRRERDVSNKLEFQNLLKYFDEIDLSGLNIKQFTAVRFEGKNILAVINYGCKDVYNNGPTYYLFW
jgi:hypothetical protein